MTLPERLEELMAHHRFNLMKLTRASGVDYNTIRRVMRGEYKSIKLRDAVLLARAFGIRVDDLIKGIDAWDRTSTDVDDSEYAEVSG